MIFLSPLMSFASVIEINPHEITEMNCCADEGTEENHDCCHDEGTSDSDNSCDDHNCPMQDCQFMLMNFFHVYYFETAKDESVVDLSTRLKIDTYQSFLIEDLNHSIWNPPKYIS